MRVAHECQANQSKNRNNKHRASNRLTALKRAVTINNHTMVAPNRLTDSGFSILELVAVIAVLAALTAIALPRLLGFVSDSYQVAATVEVEHLLKTLSIHRAYNGKWPSNWSEIEKYLSHKKESAYDSCSKYGSQCNNNERVIVNGQYLISFYSRGDEIRVSAWRFSNDGDSSTNRSVWGCIRPGGKSFIYAWKKDGSYWQGPAWNGGIKDDNGNPLSGC